jgi:hypothetical protein
MTNPAISQPFSPIPKQILPEHDAIAPIHETHALAASAMNRSPTSKRDAVCERRDRSGQALGVG